MQRNVQKFRDRSGKVNFVYTSWVCPLSNSEKSSIPLMLFHSPLEIFEISYPNVWSNRKSLAPKKSFILSLVETYKGGWGFVKQKRDEITENRYCRTSNSCHFETPTSYNSHWMKCIRIRKEKTYFELVVEALNDGEKTLMWAELTFKKVVSNYFWRIFWTYLMEKLRFFDVRGFRRWYSRII